MASRTASQARIKPRCLMITALSPTDERRPLTATSSTRAACVCAGCPSGLGRVKTDEDAGHNECRRCWQGLPLNAPRRSDAHDVYDPSCCRPGRVGPSRGNPWKRLHQEVVAPMRALIVPNGCSTVSHRYAFFLIFVEPALHGFDALVALGLRVGCAVCQRS